MSTLSRYLLLRTGSRVLVLLMVFLFLAVGGQLGLAVGRGVPILALVPTLPSILMLALPIAIPLALASGVLVTISAMHRDGEFRALASSGLRTAEVVSRLWPLLAVSVLAAAVFTHILLPEAMLGMRTNQERQTQAALAHQVNSGRPLYSEAGSQAFAMHASGHTLDHIFLTRTDADATVAMYARGASWYVAAGEQSKGLGLELEDMRVLRREPDGRVNLVTAPSAQYPLEENVDTDIDLKNPDTWSTPRLLSFVQQWDGSDATQRRRDYNNALLSLHYRLFTPISLVAFALFAAGLGLRRGSSDSLMAVIIVVVIVALNSLPALFYVKNAVDHPVISPGWLLWPQAILLAGLGLRWIARPQLSQDQTLSSGWIAGLKTRIGYRIATLVRRRISSRESRLTTTTPSRFSVLSRLILRQALGTWVGVLFIGTFLVVVGQLLNRIGLYVRAIASKPIQLLEYFTASLPEFISLWLPLSVGAAALLVAAPLLRRGNLMALSASGIPLRRVFAPFLGVAVLACLCTAVVDDQVVTRLTPVVMQLELDLKDKKINDRRPQPMGWSHEDNFWMSNRGQPAQATFATVAAFRGSRENGRALLADSLSWQEPDGWHVYDGVEVATTGERRAFTDIAITELGWAALPPPATLALNLLPDTLKTSTQLLAAQSPVSRNVLIARGLSALTPLFALLFALPGFIRFENRHHIATALVSACFLLAVPIVVVAIANRAILSNQGQPLVTAIITATALLLVGGWRWVRMRP